MKAWNSRLNVGTKPLRSKTGLKRGKRKIERKIKTERQLLVLACDNIFRQIIRIRAGFKSEKTGRGYHPEAKGLDVAHFITRDNKRVRWDLDNAFLLTKGEHEWWASVHKEQWRRWVRDRIGEERFETLLLRARARGTVATHRLKLIKLWLIQELEKIKEGKYERGN